MSQNHLFVRVSIAVVLCSGLLLSACHRSSQPTTPALLGTSRPTQDFLAVVDSPGPIQVETIASASWQVDRDGLINLDHPEAADLDDGPEPIEIYFHALRHPTKGLFIVDTGVERRYRDALDETPTSWLVRAAMDTSTLEVHLPLREYLDRQPTRLRGVFLTHLHLDHVMGLPDVDNAVPIYVGPDETSESDWTNLLLRSSIDGHLANKHALRVMAFTVEPQAPLHAVLDVFDDGSLWAIWVPGHTAGSVAYLARTPEGPVLMTGDACHTRFGWDHNVEPGSFSSDQPRSAVSLHQLKAFVARHPKIEVRLGHQTPTPYVTTAN